MIPSPFSAREIEEMKKRAKRLAKQQGLSHSQALDAVARGLGFGNWSQLGKGAPKMPPTKRAMLKWFAANHRAAVNISPWDGREGGYLYPTVEVCDELENQFPDADPDVLEALSVDLETDGPFVSEKFLASLDIGWEPEPPDTQQTRWEPPIKKGRYRSAEVLGIDTRHRYIKVACVRYRERPITDDAPGLLIFRCPVCNKIHRHGGGRDSFGSGDGDRLPHCNIPTAVKDFHFDLVEVRDPARAGHLLKHHLQHIRTPEA